MARNRIRTFVVALSIAGGVAGVGARGAHAGDPNFDDPKSRYEITMALTINSMDLAEALKKGDADAAIEQLGKLPTLWHKAKIKTPVGSKYGNSAGGALQQTKLARVRPVALQTILDCEDPEGGWASVKPVLPKNDGPDPTPFEVEILKAVGTMHPEGAIDSLLTTLLRAKSTPYAAEVAAVLGHYSTSKQRERILAEMVKIAKTTKPGAAPAPPTALVVITARWDALKGPIAAALDALTGASGGDLDAWIKTVDAAKGNLKPLFKEKGKAEEPQKPKDEE